MKLKIKTKKTAAKRFKVSKTGKIIRKHATTSHLRSKESARVKRRKDHKVSVTEADYKRMERLLVF